MNHDEEARPKSNKPRPYVFSSLDEFRDAVREAAPLLNTFLETRYDSVTDAVRASVGVNTIRAFRLRQHNPACRPLELYRSTVTNYFTENFDRFRKLRDSAEYEKFIDSSALEIEQVFDTAANQKGFMGFGRAAKLFNLTCKYMLCHSQLTNEERKRLSTLAHVPLDSFSLQAIRKFNTPVRIPANASMGWVEMNDGNRYSELQNWIRGECKRVDRFPIHFEIAAWDKAHPQKKTGEESDKQG